MIGGAAQRGTRSPPPRISRQCRNRPSSCERSIDAPLRRPRPVPFFQIDFTQTRVLLLTPYASNRKVRGIVTGASGRASERPSWTSVVSVRFVFFSHDAVSLSLAPFLPPLRRLFHGIWRDAFGSEETSPARAVHTRSRAPLMALTSHARGSRARSARIITPFLLFRSVSPCCTFTVVVTFSSGLLSYDVCNGCRRRQECLNEPGVSPEKFSVSLRLHRTSYVNGLFPFFAPLSAVSLLF